jgi:anti-sigma B factor antagonist
MLCAARQRASPASVLKVQGNLRVPLNSDLRSRVGDLLRRGDRRIALDLSSLSSIDAAGIGELIHAYNMTTAQGGALRLVGCQPRVRRLLEVTGLFELLTHGASLERDALAAKRPWRP